MAERRREAPPTKEEAHVGRPPGATNLFLAAGESGAISTAALGSGTHRFMCCIHPWMRATYQVQ